MKTFRPVFFCLATMLSAFLARADTNYFLVADPSGMLSGSYVLPLTNPVQIAHARKLIQQGPSAGQPIVTATISAGFDCINRDYRAQGAPAWSWHVTRCCDFADFTIELCDGTPATVEQDVNRWMDNTGGTICFWSYTVVQELTISPPAPPPSPAIRAVIVTTVMIQLSITNLAASYLCSIDRTFNLQSSPCGTSWRTVASFPIDGSSADWSEKIANGSDQVFYRVRIDCAH